MDYKLQSDIIIKNVTPGQNNIKQMTREEVLNVLANLSNWTHKNTSNWGLLFAKGRLGGDTTWTEQSISRRLRELQEDIYALKASLEIEKLKEL